MAPKKILVLHGYAHSAAYFSKKIAAVCKACGDDVEFGKAITITHTSDFVIIHGPIVLTPADLGRPADDVSAADADDSDPAMAPRAWWTVDAPKTITVGIELSIQLLRDYLIKDHYDGILGFSQGAAMAAIMSTLLERPEVFPGVLVDGKPPHPPFKFCITVAGYKPKSPQCDLIFKPTYSTPTLHIIGRNDIVIVEEDSLRLVAINTNHRVEYHDGGHFMPSKTSWRNFLKAYIQDPLADIPSPSPKVASSGTATPLTFEL
ncbi:FSH1-domain-containing protein [Lenzites betulinus]|nr:FSH1-domain-containing protein [Lenzites betulinus]